MAAPLDLREWAATLRNWARSTNDANMAAEMRRLADQLEELAPLKEGAVKDRASVE
jgi:hypothetical protein